MPKYSLNSLQEPSDEQLGLIMQDALIQVKESRKLGILNAKKLKLNALNESKAAYAKLIKNGK